jgi:hypothetical protein
LPQSLTTRRVAFGAFLNRTRRWLATRLEGRWHVVVMAVVLAAGATWRFAAVRESLPYCRHVDEKTWLNIAGRMLANGDPHPRRFRKPSLPVYLITGGLALGVVQAKLGPEKVSLREPQVTEDQHYSAPSVAEVPKRLFVLLAVAAAGLAGFVGAQLSGKPALLWLTPLIVGLSATYTRLSWSYMTVDVVGAFFTLLTLAYLVASHHRDTALGRPPGGASRAVIAGALAGLTVGSKYNLVPILLAVVLWFFFYERKHFFSRSFVVGATAVGVFFLTTPYAILDHRLFIQQILAEARHYATGHDPKNTLEPGFPMLWRHVLHFGTDWGWIPLGLSIAGAAILVRRSVRMAIVLLAFPIAFTAYMSLQRVFFERNLLGVHLIVALCLGVAVLELPPLLVAAGARYRSALATSRLARPLATVAITALALVGVPWTRVGSTYLHHVEPRNAAARWVEKHVPRDTTVLVDKALAMDLRRLTPNFRTKVTALPTRSGAAPKLPRKRPTIAIIKRDKTEAYSKLFGESKVLARFAGQRTGRSSEVVVLKRVRGSEPTSPQPPRSSLDGVR